MPPISTQSPHNTVTHYQSQNQTARLAVHQASKGHFGKKIAYESPILSLLWLPVESMRLRQPFHRRCIRLHRGQRTGEKPDICDIVHFCIRG
jgi:hypothetical protein